MIAAALDPQFNSSNVIRVKLLRGWTPFKPNGHVAHHHPWESTSKEAEDSTRHVYYWGKMIHPAHINLYMTDNPLQGDMMPLNWWKSNVHRYPRLASLSQKILTIPDTSTLSERIFSTAGLTVTMLRSCIKQKNDLFFLTTILSLCRHDNIFFVHE